MSNKSFPKYAAGAEANKAHASELPIARNLTTHVSYSKL